MKITVLYDNRQFADKWETGWGFACLVETEEDKLLLFDTGDDGDKLLNNIEKSGVDSNDIDALTFSHADWDHADGAEAFLKKNKSVEVFIPDKFPGKFINMVKQYGNKYRVTGYERTELILGVFTTPVYKRGFSPREQGLVLAGKKDLALITGCAHPGILYMVKEVKKLFRKNVGMILGGFHLMGLSRPALTDLISKLKQEGVRVFAPCHCTGDKQIAAFQEECGEDYIEVGAGRRIEYC
ncbi:MAG: MBL fold metallo-hydrolase [Elusimicrobiota bacterium]